MAEWRTRRGLTLVETMVSAAIVTLTISGTVLHLRQSLWTARRNHEYLIADSLAWDVLWRAYNTSSAWTPPSTNETLRTVVTGPGSAREELYGADALEREHDDRDSQNKRLKVRLTVADIAPDAEVSHVLPKPGGGAKELVAEVSWGDLRPIILVDGQGNEAPMERRSRRFTMRKSAYDRAWHRVETDIDGGRH